MPSIILFNIVSYLCIDDDTFELGIRYISHTNLGMTIKAGFNKYKFKFLLYINAKVFSMIKLNIPLNFNKIVVE